MMSGAFRVSPRLYQSQLYASYCLSMRLHCWGKSAVMDDLTTSVSPGFLIYGERK